MLSLTMHISKFSFLLIFILYLYYIYTNFVSLACLLVRNECLSLQDIILSIMWKFFS